MSDQTNIFPFGSPGENKEKLSEDTLMAYLDGKLPVAEQRKVELWLSEEGMESDAIEGLRQLNSGETKHTIDKLKHSLRKSLISKKRKRRPMLSGQFTWVAIAIVLLLTVLAYLVIKMIK